MTDWKHRLMNKYGLKKHSDKTFDMIVKKGTNPEKPYQNSGVLSSIYFRHGFTPEQLDKGVYQAKDPLIQHYMIYSTNKSDHLEHLMKNSTKDVALAAQQKLMYLRKTGQSR